MIKNKDNEIINEKEKFSIMYSVIPFRINAINKEFSQFKHNYQNLENIIQSKNNEIEVIN